MSNAGQGCDCVRKVLKKVSRSRVVESLVPRAWRSGIINHRGHRDHRGRSREEALCASNQSSVKLVTRSASITCSCVVEALVPRAYRQAVDTTASTKGRTAAAAPSFSARRFTVSYSVSPSWSTPTSFAIAVERNDFHPLWRHASHPTARPCADASDQQVEVAMQTTARSNRVVPSINYQPNIPEFPDYSCSRSFHPPPRARPSNAPQAPVRAPALDRPSGRPPPR